MEYILPQEKKRNELSRFARKICPTFWHTLPLSTIDVAMDRLLYNSGINHALEIFDDVMIHCNRNNFAFPMYDRSRFKN